MPGAQEPIVNRGKGLRNLKKLTDGSRKAFCDMYNSELARYKKILPFEIIN